MVINFLFALYLSRKRGSENENENNHAACHRNGSHTSRSDPSPHGTVRVKTAVQTTAGKHQVAHIYFDNNFTYTGHTIYPSEKND